ncbi:unnamed protein product [Alopecurus aequalis]
MSRFGTAAAKQQKYALRPNRLLASAAINLGLALVALSLFSMLKKQAGNAPVYLPRRMATAGGGGGLLPLGAGRLTPSFRWIGAAFRLSEDDVLRLHGLDALAVIRLFKFGNLVLIAYPFYFKQEYKEMSLKRIEHLKYHRNRPDQFTILVQGIPLCADHGTYGCHADHFFSKHYLTYQSYQILHDIGNIESLQKLASSLERQIRRKRDTRRCNFLRWIWFKFTLGPIDVHSQEQKLKEVQESIRLQQCKNMLKQKELPVAFVSFKSRLEAAQAAEMQQHANPLALVTRYAPEPTEAIWSNLAIPFCRLAVYKLRVFIAAFLLTVFFTIPVTAVQGIVQFEKIKKWFPLARAVQLIPGLNSVVTGYLPSMILNGFIYLIPFAMLGMASFEGCISKSQKEIKACNMVFYFLLGNVFFLSILSGSLLDQIGESFTHPKDIPSRLARAVSAQAHSVGHTDEPYLYGFPYYRVVPIVSLAVLIGMVYAVVAPLLLPILVIYFLLGYAVFINQMEDVYEITYDTCGQYWPTIHHYIFLSVTLMQTTMIGLFGLKSKAGASFTTIPLLVLNIMFNEYCKVWFLPTFQCRPVQICKENDDLDKTEVEAEGSSDHAIKAYTPPWMRLTGCSSESSSVQPLVRCLI